MTARSLRMASAPDRPQRAPVRSMRSLTRCRQAPSMTPVEIGQPWGSAVGESRGGGLVGVGACALTGVRGVVGGLAGDGGGDGAGASGKDCLGVAGDPPLGAG